MYLHEKPVTNQCVIALPALSTFSDSILAGLTITSSLPTEGTRWTRRVTDLLTQNSAAGRQRIVACIEGVLEVLGGLNTGDDRCHSTLRCDRGSPPSTVFIDAGGRFTCGRQCRILRYKPPYSRRMWRLAVQPVSGLGWWLFPQVLTEVPECGYAQRYDLACLDMPLEKGKHGMYWWRQLGQDATINRSPG